MPERGPGRFRPVVLAVALLLSARIADAQPPADGLESRWRALVDTAKLEDALALARGEAKASPVGSPAYWTASWLVAETLAEKGDRLAARDEYRRIAEGAPPALGELRGRALVGIGYASLRPGEEANVVPTVAKARSLVPLESGTDAALEAAILDAEVRLRLGQVREALGLAEQGALHAQSGGVVRQDYLLRFRALEADAYERSGDMTRARDAYGSAATHVGDWALRPPVKATLWVELAELAHRFGDEERGLDFARKAVDWIVATHGPDHPSLVAAENARSAIASSFGAGAEAVDAAEDALRIARLGKGTSIELAAEENALGNALMGVGRLDEAEVHLTAAAAALGSHAQGVLAGRVYGSLGAVALQSFYFQGAKRWLELARRALGGTASDVRRALVPVLSREGELARMSEALDGALRLDGQALSIAMEEYGPDHDEVGRSLANLGAAVMDDGRPADAEPMLRRSVEILTARLGVDHPDLARPRMLLTACLFNEGKPTADSASELAHAFRAETRRLEALAPRSRPEDLRRYIETNQATTWMATWLALRPDASPEVRASALGMVLTRKSFDQDVERARLRAVRAGGGDGAAALLVRLAAARAELARALLQGVPARDHLRTLQASVDRLELELSRQAGLARSGPPVPVRTVDVAEVARALPPGAALVELVSFKPVVGSGRAGIPAGDRIAAYVLRPEGPVEVRDLGPVQSLTWQVAAVRNAVQAGDPARAALGTIYAGVVAPWVGITEKADLLFLAPDGPLTLLPFEMLTRPDGKSMLETTRISYRTSGRDLIDLAAARPLRHELGAALLVGDPDYDRQAAATTTAPGSLLGRVRWPRLPGTALEIHAIAATLPGATVRLGAEADEGALSSAGSARIVHLATHGFFLDSTGVPAAKSRGLVLEAPGTAPPPESEETMAARTRVLESLSDHPEIRSGLVLAGANSAGVNGTGYLAASQLETVDLSSTDLVVLSACETGVGETTAGMGVTGLRRSLAVAGARSEVMSLWKVDDAATAELMKQFYQGVGAGLARSDALRAAKLSVRAHPEWSAPYFWAAFQLFGDWRPIIESPTSAAPLLAVHPRAGCACTSLPGNAAAGPMALAGLGGLALLIVLRRRRSVGAGALVVAGVLAASSAAHAEPPATTADALALNERASQKILQGEFPQGLALIQRALRIEPDSDALLFNAAGLAARANDHKAARTYYGQAIEQALAVDAHHRAQSYGDMLMQLAETENGAFMAASAKSASVTSDSDTKGAIDVDAQINQANTSLLQGDYAGAAAVATSAEALCRQVLPRDVVRQARARSLIGLGLADSGHPEGVPMLESAVATMSEAVGKDHPEVLVLRSSLASALLAVGKSPEAIAVLESVVADSARRFGKDSAFELKTRSNLVMLYAKGKRPHDAIAVGQKTLEPCRRELGAHSPFCLHLMTAIAEGQYVAGNMLAAREAATRALVEQVRTTGVGGSNVLTPSHYPAAPVDPAVEELLGLLVGIDLGPGAHDAAQTMRSRATVYTRVLGPNDLATVRVEVVVGELDLRSTKPEVGARKLGDLHHRVDKAYGAYSPVALDLAALAAAGLLAAGKAEGAEPLAVETSRRVRQVMGAGSEQGITALFTEAMVKVRLHRPDGVALMQEAAVRAAALGPGNPLAAQMQQAAAAFAAAH